MNFPTDPKFLSPEKSSGYAEVNGFSEPDGELYGDEEAWNPGMDADDDDDNVFEDRDSYRNANLDDVYYFI